MLYISTIWVPTVHVSNNGELGLEVPALQHKLSSLYIVVRLEDSVLDGPALQISTNHEAHYSLHDLVETITGSYVDEFATALRQSVEFTR